MPINDTECTTVVNGSGTVVYDTGDNNQLDSDGVWEYTYDDEGNMTEKNFIGTDEKWVYAYDEKNRLVAADHYDDTLTLDLAVYYQYDVFGNRVLKAVDDDGAGPNVAEITRYSHDGWNPAKPTPIGIENFDIWLVSDGEGDPIYREIQGEGFDEHLARIADSSAYFYLDDHLNSIRAVLDDTGTPVDEIEYDAFGNITLESNSANRGLYAYTGREFDVETQLQYNRARYYDATTGRWISQDPLGFDAGDSNLYRYVKNSPSFQMDPSGLQPLPYFHPSTGEAIIDGAVWTWRWTAPLSWIIKGGELGIERMVGPGPLKDPPVMRVSKFSTSVDLKYDFMGKENQMFLGIVFSV